MSIEFDATFWTLSVPTSPGHVGMPTPLRYGADLDALLFPHRIMVVFGSHQRVSNLVQHRVTDMIQIVAYRVVHRNFDAPVLFSAQSHRPLAAIETELPLVQAVLGHQGLCELLDLHQVGADLFARQGIHFVGLPERS